MPSQLYGSQFIDSEVKARNAWRWGSGFAVSFPWRGCIWWCPVCFWGHTLLHANLFCILMINFYLGNNMSELRNLSKSWTALLLSTKKKNPNISLEYILKWMFRNSNGFIQIIQEMLIQENNSKIAGGINLSERKKRRNLELWVKLS